MEQKEKKTGAIIGTVAAILLCGCPGLIFCLLGIASIAGIVPYTTTVNGYQTTGTVPMWLGFVGLCVAIIFIAIAIVVPVMTLRKKKVVGEAAPVDVLPPQEPLPPAS
jgi:TRAP-type C4-dicarboxylate transport system permease small subunit